MIQTFKRIFTLSACSDWATGLSRYLPTCIRFCSLHATLHVLPFGRIYSAHHLHLYCIYRHHTGGSLLLPCAMPPAIICRAVRAPRAARSGEHGGFLPAAIDSPQPAGRDTTTRFVACGLIPTTGTACLYRTPAAIYAFLWRDFYHLRDCAFLGSTQMVFL